MNERPLLVVSDIHLGAVPAATERAFRGFLSFAADRASGLLINGDLFDFWFEYRSVVLREHYRVLASLAEVVERGLIAHDAPFIEKPFMAENFRKKIDEDGIHPNNQKRENPSLVVFHIDKPIEKCQSQKCPASRSTDK